MSLSPNQRERLEARMQRPFPSETIERPGYEYEQLRNVAPRLVLSNEEHLKANAESRLASYRKSQHARTIALAVSIITFALLCAAYHFIGTYCLPPQ